MKFPILHIIAHGRRKKKWFIQVVCLGFAKGRQILDLVLTTKEAINSRLKNGLNGMISKVNTEKAYNHVSWDYLLEILNKMNFCQHASVFKWYDLQT